MKRIAILGTGGMGRVHARHYRRLPVDLAVFDAHAERAQELAAMFEVPVLGSFEEALEWADAVDICTPNDTHADLALRSLGAGLPTLVEKPIAHSLEEARAMVAASETTPLVIGHVVRFFPEYRRTHELVKAGKIGRPAAIRLRRGGAVPRAPWFMDHSRSGGVLVDLAIHEFDWLSWTFGPVDQLYARSVGAATDQGPDYGLCTLTFKSGAVAHVEATWMDPAGFRTEIEVCGSEGMLQFDSRRASALSWGSSAGTRFESPLSADDDPYYQQLGAFLHVVEGSAAPAVSGEEGLRALELALAARESARTGEVIHF